MNKKLLNGLFALSLSAVTVAISHADQATEIADTKQAVKDYVFQRQELATKKHEWLVYQDVTTRRIEFFSKEIERLTQEIEAISDVRSSAEAKIAEKNSQIEALQEANNIVLKAVPAYEAKIATLAQYFPAPLKKKVQPLLDNLGRSKQAAQRMALVLGILNEVDKFNTEWTSDSFEVDGTLVDVLYMGLSTAFYANEKGTIGGTLNPAKGEWERVPANELAPEIAKSIIFYRGKVKPAELVPVPLQITEVGSVK